ncbi:PQQ-binding-like beta-propeller repeat protein [Streptomyces sp. ML-6]|uniref:outer membrane protein assembly factor BamB family protein n=1 Tax=Streptomyces sp. ML-6 TaxID=2982693 RepID=UPI0024C08D66|nr:PQQ-binding-like beta-propeller repeat protein [Streptomyces sp. ML-6]MDK0519977.1 PQQ-binding-like beta-propeller repeat protein [Streptomyces sp. ML-6]
MTQPPGQQPPQGGFGAPYDPATGPDQPSPAAPPAPAPAPGPGYGTPAQPGPYNAPSQPGPYNAPAQPGPYNTPAQPGPYGNPAQPGPYNAPAQPGPYNVPTQPGPYNLPAQTAPYGGPGQPGGPAGNGGGGFFRGRRGAVLGAVLAVALLAGGGVWLAVGGDDGKKSGANGSTGADQGSSSGGKGGGKNDKSGDADADKAAAERAEALRAEVAGINDGRKTGEAKALWLQEGGVDLPRNGSDVYGPWIVGDTVVKAMYRTVSGYSVGDGRQKWSLRLPGSMCAAPSQATADGRIVLGVMSGSGTEEFCDALQMVDLNTGKAGWYKKYKRVGAWDGLSDPAMAINGDTVTVGRKTRTDAFRVSDGKVLFGELPGNCQPFGFASGPVAVAAASCQTAADDHKEQQVKRIDPATGKVLWTYKVKKGWEISQFYSVSPLVVSLRKPEEKKWAVLLLNDNGTYRSQLVGDDPNYRTRCDTDLLTSGKALDGCLGVTADEHGVYLATEPESGLDPTNKVVAFDLNTGKVKWKADSPAGQTLMPMRAEGGRLLMHLGAVKGKGGGILSLPPTGGTPQTVLRHPASGADAERELFEPKVAYADGRSFLMSSRISGIEDGDEEKAKSMGVYGN